MNAITISQKQTPFFSSLWIYYWFLDQKYKHTKRNIGRIKFIKNFALAVGTTPSNVYTIIRDVTIHAIEFPTRTVMG